jgi:hypothetical protein
MVRAMPCLLSRRDACAYIEGQFGIRYSPNYLTRLASTGGGPTYYRVGGKVGYDKADLEAWVRARSVKVLSTASEILLAK